MMKLMNIFGGSHGDVVTDLQPQPARRALPAPVMPCPPPAPRLEGPPSGSYKDGTPEEQVAKAAKEKAGPPMPTPTLLAGLAAMAQETAKKLGVNLTAPHSETVSRPGGEHGVGVFLGVQYFGDVTARLLFDCAKEVGIELATAAELATLKQLDDRWRTAHGKLAECAPTSDRVRFIIERNQQAVGTPAFRALSPDDARQICIEEGRIVRNELRAITAAGATIAAAIHPRLMGALAKQIGRLLEEELKTAAKHAMPFAPSVYLSTLDKGRTAAAAVDLSAPFECAPRAWLLGLAGLLIDQPEAKK